MRTKQDISDENVLPPDYFTVTRNSNFHNNNDQSITTQHLAPFTSSLYPIGISRNIPSKNFS
jgi:hypothetical protein